MIPVIHTIPEVRQAVSAARGQGKSVSFVPTMGALHEGHAALIRKARTLADFVVVSIFVNPTQFGPHEDFTRYPRTLEADRELSEAAGASAIFHPSAEEMYPTGFHTFVEVQELDRTLCGPRRPGHFRGVCTVVLKLFEIVRPDGAVFGAKDYQQAAIIQRMVRDLNMPVAIHVLPTVREGDGLAMSSRNRYLSTEERRLAPRLYAALQYIRQLSRHERSVPVLEKALQERIAEIPGARIDYATIVDAEDLQPITVLERPAVAALAVFLGGTRLIDNLILDIE